MVVDGNTYIEIAEHLNNTGAETPGQFGIRVNNDEVKEKSAVWSEYYIRTILRNPVYLGHMAQGKISKEQGTKKAIRVPESEQYIVYNTHEAIIDKELWERVKPLLDKRTATHTRRKNVESNPNT